MLVIDAANVIGSQPTGWWRDRPGAARHFTERVRATVTAGRLDPPVILVLEGRARAGADEAVVDGVEVVHARGEGDDTIAAIAEAHREVIVVTGSFDEVPDRLDRRRRQVTPQSASTKPLILLAARHHSVTAADGQIGDHRHNHRSVTRDQTTVTAHIAQPAGRRTDSGTEPTAGARSAHHAHDEVPAQTVAAGQLPHRQLPHVGDEPAGEAAGDPAGQLRMLRGEPMTHSWHS